ncbi:Gfo/Idh/MocA family oxidoreductase [Legionella sp. W05-934-2]|uniref:Gfo/Idh/MocA family oxidoreductase n=1 Tax=Legionella sp. W05-934-2 TaxID=1198649 RepID=UPI00346235C9
MKKIVIIGAGQLGSRHLQSLNLLDFELDILVVDPNIESLNTAKSRFEATISSVRHTIHYSQELVISGDVDVAIIASTAKVRRSIIENLVSQAHVKHLVLEKLLFNQKDDYQAIGSLIENHQIQTWVNCPMRQMAFYQQLQPLYHNKPMQLHVYGSQYGLVTNAIHYLDYVAYLTGDNDFKLNLSHLDKQVVNSKRPGYYELTGTLIAEFSNGSIASIHCNKAGGAPIQIEIYNNEHRAISREWEHAAWVTGENYDWKWQEVSAEIPFQSVLTANLVKELLLENKCALPDYRTSAHTHLQLLCPLETFVAEVGFKKEMDFPFT